MGSLVESACFSKLEKSSLKRQAPEKKGCKLLTTALRIIEFCSKTNSAPNASLHANTRQWHFQKTVFYPKCVSEEFLLAYGASCAQGRRLQRAPKPQRDISV